MIELTDQQRHEMNGESPPRVHDPKSNVTYVLVRADVYEKMRQFMDGVTKRAGWDDPKLDEYERFRDKA
jgi:hypothetical protein